MESIDALVVGAGVVGLACARAAARRGLSVVLVERHARAGEETSSRNSGVIHSGIYYPTASLKARLCVSGRERLYAYCSEREIPHRRCGKLVVAQAAQVDALRALAGKARANGVTDFELLNQDEAKELEPAVRCAAALHVPCTGIIDVHEYMQALEGDLAAADGVVAYGTEFLGTARHDDGFVARLRGAGEVSELRCRRLVNSAGLSAVALLECIEGYPLARGHRAWYAKGNYFSCRGTKPFRHLVYPMPTDAGLGVHATLDLDGRTRFGPDVEWVDAIAYEVDASREASFYASIREYLPGLPDGALEPAYAGVRPKRVGPGAAAADFLIEGPADHGIPGLVNLIGIESPGLTSSLAIGDEVTRLLAA